MGQFRVLCPTPSWQWTQLVSVEASVGVEWTSGREEGPGIWGAYNYDADMDVFRVSMMMGELPMSVDQFSIFFSDVTEGGGTLNLAWENTMASVNFMAH